MLGINLFILIIEDRVIIYGLAGAYIRTALLS